MSFYRNPVVLIIQGGLEAISEKFDREFEDASMRWATPPKLKFRVRSFNHCGKEYHRVSLEGRRGVVLTILDSIKGDIEAVFYLNQHVYVSAYSSGSNPDDFLGEGVIKKKYLDMNQWESDTNIQKNYETLASIIARFLTETHIHTHPLEHKS